MKSYTDIEQSRKLAEILPIKSADLMWEYEPNKDTYLDKPTMIPIESYIFINDIPCWSLVALLNVIPSGKALIHDKGNLGYKCICNNMDTYFHDNPLDACYEMIVKLYELKML